ncbi:glycoside hydrolase [Naegleria gruberi]|uniref:Glycoside hydrolase n=1 Tax=Naegleria gruberi TaxID=5762 RepID=D2UYN2_NAEGR|nr:glycoside hydrolase [Naegleria gruberi]EFC50504.1 glycoside hydrolase [Naegleria gruberi]|eukprot:XP_002683248.1 glycoside hydrolase [Naegleria gruberi strain NEG-M]
MPAGAWIMNKLYTLGNGFYDMTMTKQSDRVKYKYEKKMKQVEKFVSEDGAIKSHSIDQKKVIITFDNSRLTLRCIDNIVWKVSFMPKESVEYPSLVVSDDALNFVNIIVDEENEDFITFKPADSALTKLKLNKKNLSIDILTQFTNDQYTTAFSNIKVATRPKDEQATNISFGYNVSTVKSVSNDWFGLGEKSNSVKKNGKKYLFWNWDSFAYQSETDPLYQSIPFGIVSSKFEIDQGKTERRFNGIFIDNYGMQQWDLTSEEHFSANLESFPCNVYFMANNAKTPFNISKTYEQLTGANPMVPLWVLGYHQCRWSYYPDTQVKEIAQEFLDRDIPCDVIYLDIDYMDGYRDFTWSKTDFPNPRELLKWLHERKFKVVTILDPGVKVDSNYDVYKTGVEGNHFCAYPNGKLYEGVVWPGATHMPSYTSEPVRKWWADWYKGLIEDGVDGFWNDMNCPSVKVNPIEAGTMDDNVLQVMDAPYPSPQMHKDIHNFYGSSMAIASREGIEKFQRPLNRRSFLFARACFAGIQKHAGSWSGDNMSTFEHLAISLRLLMGQSICGQLMVGADIGGFRWNCFPELYARWIAFGSIFYPYCRSHTDKFTIQQEPWSFGEQVEAISKKFIKLRYQLMPYLYTASVLHSKRSMPMIRPLFYDFSSDEECYNQEWLDTQGMIGNALMVAPILHEKQTSRKVYLPKLEEEKWYDFFNPANSYEGGQVITVEAPLDHLPVFVKGGSVIPMRQTHAQSVYDLHLVDLTFKSFGSIVTSQQNYLYLDDGISLDYENGLYGFYQIEDANGTLKLLEGNGFPTRLEIGKDFENLEQFTAKFY